MESHQPRDPGLVGQPLSKDGDWSRLHSPSGQTQARPWDTWVAEGGPSVLGPQTSLLWEETTLPSTDSSTLMRKLLLPPPPREATEGRGTLEAGHLPSVSALGWTWGNWTAALNGHWPAELPEAGCRITIKSWPGLPRDEPGCRCSGHLSGSNCGHITLWGEGGPGQSPRQSLLSL